MIEIKVPGYKSLEIENIAIDFNGTLGIDGKIIEATKEILNFLALQTKIYIITADTYGNVREQLNDISCELKIISGQNQAYTKQQFIKQLGSEKTIAIGNGRNDYMMLEESSIGIALIQKEGGAVGAINSADIVMTDIISALELLTNPMRLIATLRA